MSEIKLSPLEIQWLELEDSYFKGHKHVWQMDAASDVFVCIADGCPSKKQHWCGRGVRR